MTIYKRKPDTISGRLHDELVMMDIEQGKYFSLNPVATRIWDLLVQPCTSVELCQLLLDEYEVDESQCQAEIAEYLLQMEKYGLIVKSDFFKP